MMRGATRTTNHGEQRVAEEISSALGVGGSPSAFGGWEQRIYGGLLLSDIPTDVREGLAHALGAAGVEAEHLLRFLTSFFDTENLSPALGGRLLDQLQSFGRRFLDLANDFELAAQSYVTALRVAPHGLHPPIVPGGEPWWPPFAGLTLESEPLELRLRRCGYSYRQAVALRLGPTVEALADQMGLLLHALRTLPPAGTVSTAVLAHGLDELADALQGDVAQHLLRDANDDFPGLLSAVERLRESGPGAPLAEDLAWARGEYERAVSASAQASSQAAKPGLVARIFHTAPAVDASQRWSQSAAREWRDLIVALEALQREEGSCLS